MIRGVHECPKLAPSGYFQDPSGADPHSCKGSVHCCQGEANCTYLDWGVSVSVSPAAKAWFFGRARSPTVGMNRNTPYAPPFWPSKHRSLSSCTYLCTTKQAPRRCKLGHHLGQYAYRTLLHNGVVWYGATEPAWRGL